MKRSKVMIEKFEEKNKKCKEKVESCNWTIDNGLLQKRAQFYVDIFYMLQFIIMKVSYRLL